MRGVDNTYLIRVDTEAGITRHPNNYESLRSAVGAHFDFAPGSDIGAYVDDEGLLKGMALNVVASFVCVRPLYGPAVLCQSDPDDEGDNVALNDGQVRFVEDVAKRWYHVLRWAAAQGQSLDVFATPETLPPPVIIPWEGP